MLHHRRNATVDLMTSNTVTSNIPQFRLADQEPMRLRQNNKTTMIGHRRAFSHGPQPFSNQPVKPLTIKPLPYATFTVTVVSPNGAQSRAEEIERPSSDRAESCRGTLSTLPTATSSAMPLTPLTIEIEATNLTEDNLTAQFFPAFKQPTSKSPSKNRKPSTRRKWAVFYLAGDSDDDSDDCEFSFVPPRLSSPIALNASLRRNLALCDVKVAITSTDKQLCSPTVSLSV